MLLRDGKKPLALCIETQGDLECSSEQAIVSVQIGDVILQFYGEPPAEPANPNLSIRAFQVTLLMEKTDGSIGIYTKEISLPEGWEREVPWEATETETGSYSWHPNVASADHGAK